MQIKNLYTRTLLLLSLLISGRALAQAPVANFSVSPNPACTNASNGAQITDLSTNVPTSWSYTVAIFGPGPGGSAIYSSQNPFVTFNFPGTYTITLVSTNANGSSAAVTQTLSVLRSPDANITPANLNACIGSSAININVTPSGPGGASYQYNWSTGATSTSITISPTVTTTYSCIVTATNGCTTLKTSTINIGQPTVTINSNPATICPGSSSTLSAIISGQGPHSYSWSTGTTSNSITVSAAGIYSVTATNGLGCSNVQTYSISSSSTLSLNAGATPSAICAGNNGNLHVSGAGSYTWNTGATTANVMVNPMVTTIYTVIGTFGACSGSATVLLLVSQIPTITIVSNTNSICSGNSVSMTASGAAGYTWNPGNIIASNVVVVPGTNTTYTVRGQNPGCPARSASFAITVLPSPVLNVTSSSSTACIGEQIALAVNGASTYSWSNGSSGAVILVSPTITTIFTVTGIGLNNCSASANLIQNMSDCTGINVYNQRILSVYPNPNNGYLNIKAVEDLNISIINQNGKVVLNAALNGNNNYSLSLSDLSDGIYFITGENSKVTFKQKLVVIR